jgi:enamine deaminase RidA (YjgF/YER057c/UK114 family)
MPSRQVYTTSRKWERLFGYARSVRIGPAIEVSGCAPTAADGSTVGKGNAYEQTRQCLRLIEEALAGVGAGLEDVTRTRVFTTVPRRWREIGRAHSEVFGAIKPVTALIGVRGFLEADWLVEIEASAYRVDRGLTSGG